MSVPPLGRRLVAEFEVEMCQACEVVPSGVFADEAFVAGARLFVSALLKIEVGTKGSTLWAVAQFGTRLKVAVHVCEAMKLEVEVRLEEVEVCRVVDARDGEFDGGPCAFQFGEVARERAAPVKEITELRRRLAVGAQVAPVAGHLGEVALDSLQLRLEVGLFFHTLRPTARCACGRGSRSSWRAARRGSRANRRQATRARRGTGSDREIPCRSSAGSAGSSAQSARHPTAPVR